MSEDLDRIIAYFDALREWAMQATRPAYAEACSCGASVEVSKDVTPADRRRIANNFSGVHRGCTNPHIQPAAPSTETAP